MTRILPDCHCAHGSAYLCPIHNPPRSRLQILRDYAAAHDLSVRQVADLLAQLPDARPETEVVVLSERRAG